MEDNISAITPEQTQQQIGTLLAGGFATPAIVKMLIDEGYATDPTQAYEAIRSVYRQWNDSFAGCDFEAQDLRNWHIVMRHEILRRSMDTNPRTALAVLESLAELQEIKKSLDSSVADIPIMINLIPATKPPTAEAEDNNEETAI